MSNFNTGGWMIGYVKKEDAQRVLKNRDLMPKIVILALFMTTFMLYFMVAPKLISMANDFGQPLPMYSTPAMQLLALVLVSFGILSFKGITDQALDEKLRKYKPGEMILVADFIDMSREKKIVAMIMIYVMYLVLSYVLPIYNLTSAF